MDTYEFGSKRAEFVLVLLKHKPTARVCKQSRGMPAAGGPKCMGVDVRQADKGFDQAQIDLVQSCAVPA
ncbi:hypothetical protein, partial [Escherichia coli]|uniref:hypothetical protein n=1 Tax=Escherichia coli TaxID=562 RepID=UPI00234C65AA